jgi:iron-sulfur cluster assembly accessory protein
MVPNLTITPAAEKFMRRVVRFAGQPEAGFRLTVSAGGCSGYNAEFSAEPAPRAGDVTLLINGLKLFLPAESRPLLDGLTVDFTDTPTQSGLSIFNPAGGACACGSSAGAAPAGVSKVSIGAIRSPGKPLPG